MPKAAPQANSSAKTNTKPKAAKKKKGLSYKDAGVSIDANAEFVEYLFPRIKKTYSDRVQSPVGGFAALFNLVNDQRRFARSYKKPVLVACNDGVGTKTKVASQLKRYDTIGIDCVAMCVNDMICLGAEPLFFLDYLGVNGITQKVNRAIIDGLVDGCLQAGCALIGGETSEMPDVYAKDDFDLVGFCVGMVEEGKQITGEDVRPGDVVIGLPSSGVHSNGLTLARKALFERGKLKPGIKLAALGCSPGEALLSPTTIYVKAVLNMLAGAGRRTIVHAMANITGGGLFENIPRVLPKGCRVTLDPATWPLPPIFPLIQEKGGVSTHEMYRVFNMGIGYVVIAPQKHADLALKLLQAGGHKAVVIGSVEKGTRGVSIAGVGTEDHP